MTRRLARDVAIYGGAPGGGGGLMKLGPFAVPGYHVGDCRELLRQLPDASVNCCVTSPPYWALRDYGTGTWTGGDPACSHTRQAGGTGKSTLANYNNGLTDETSAPKVTDSGHVSYRGSCGKCGARRVDRQIGLEETPEDFVTTMVDVFREVRRVLRPDGTLWLNLGDTYAGGGHGGPIGAAALEGSRNNMEACRDVERRPRLKERVGLKAKDLIGIPWRVAFALQADGWWLRSDIVWAKPSPMPESVTDRPTKAHEYLFLLSKSADYHYDAAAVAEPMKAPREATGDGPGMRRNRRSVWTIPSEPTPDAHFATFPRKLVEPCILAGCPAGGVVLDPFGGSGTVGRVAEDLGRRWLLFDLNPAYARIAKRKTAQTGLLVRAASPTEAA